MTASVAKGQRGSLTKWINGLACGAALAWLPGYSLLIGVLLIPLIAVCLLDSNRGEVMARMMMPYAFAALVHPFHMLWNADGSMDAAVMLLMNPMTSVVGWCAAGGGWFVFEVAILGVKLTRQFQVRQRKAAIAKELATLAEEWDEQAAERS
ncbi:MAG: hypothetical protein ABF968_01540 [Acetobacter sp.]|uniref:hypothetical protein n=1 Tax=Acetobacter sp. TaxID=440 RepID=UPI0039EC0DB0